jgi:hypothetical protein
MAGEIDPGVLGELGAILFGALRYERHGAPEPGLFADLAPVFTPSQVLTTLEHLYRIGAGIRFEVARVQEALLALCPETGSEPLLGEIALSAWGLSPKIPDRLLLNAYRGMAARETNHRYRAEAVVDLAKQLPARQAAQLLFTELESAAQEPGWAYTQYDAFIPLATAISEIDPEDWIYPDLDELRAQLPRAALEIPSDAQRLLVLSSILPLLNQTDQDELLEQLPQQIMALSDNRERARLLVSLAGLLNVLLSEESPGAEGAQASSANLSPREQRKLALEQLRAEVLEEGFLAARSLDVMDREHLNLLTRLSLEAEEASVQEILDEATSPYTSGKIIWPAGETALAQAFAGLALHLPTRLHGRLASIVQTRQLPMVERQTWDLFPFASTTQLLDALNLSPEEVSNEEEQAEMLVRIVHYLPEEQRDLVLHKLLEMDWPVLVCTCLVSLLPALTERQRPLIVQVAQKLGDTWYGWRAWAALLERYPDIEPNLIPEKAHTVSAANIQRLWQGFPEKVQDASLSLMVQRLYEYYGGAAPLGDAEAEQTAAAPAEDWSDTDDGGAGDDIYFPDPDKYKEYQADEQEAAGYSPIRDLRDPDELLPPELIDELDEAEAEMEEQEPVSFEPPQASEPAAAEPAPAPTSPAEEETPKPPRAPAPAAPERPVPAAPASPPPPAGAFPSLLGKILDNLSGGKAYEPSRHGRPDRATVSTGFAPQDNPERAITDRSPLESGKEYYFLFSIGERRKFDIAPPERSIQAPLEKLPPKARLQVALFGFEGEIGVVPGQDVGELELLPNRSTRVVRRVAEPDGLSDARLLDQILFFPVRIPTRPGSYRLRANLYCQGVLVQSYLVQVLALAWLGRLAYRLYVRRSGAALETSLDYTLSNNLNTQALADLQAHGLSLLINDNGNGTHGLRFFGQAGQELLKGDASFGGPELQNLIEQGRGALRQASWGEKTEWNPEWSVEQHYKYSQARPANWKERLRTDLVVLAKWGWRFYTQTLRQLAEHGAQSQEEAEQRRQLVEQALASTRLIQIAAKESLRHVLPAALIYDYPLHDTLPGDMISLCPEFSAALENGAPLENTPCFQGACPSRGNIQVVCPSGFWGYRHVLGLPVSIGADLGNASAKIHFRESPVLAVSFSTDFTLRMAHLQRVRGLRLPLSWFEADSGQVTLEYLRTSNPHLVYFYCHGGLTEDKVPYLQVGAKNDAWGLITPSVLPAMQIRWQRPRPLVFINGCHTTALEPEAALDMVSGFVRDAGAAGVIGTEITIFEPLATVFAEEFLRLFLNGVPVGQALRAARLQLLQAGNPLGLVYIPFAVASLTLEAETE